MSTEILEFLRYGALAISAFCLFLSFFLVYRGDRSNVQVFGFMFFSVVVLIASLFADPNSGIGRVMGDVEGDTKVPEVEIEATAVNPVQRGIWDSGWFDVEDGRNYKLDHDMTSEPLIATIWYRREDSDDIHMMDGIYENTGGYGAWIMDLNSNSLVVSTGTNSSTSGYGQYNHWTAIDRGAESGSVARSVRVVISY